MTLVDRAIWQVETGLHHPLSLSDLSEKCAVSPYHLSRTFRSATGVSPMTYLRARRLSVAARALALGQRDILSIALDAQYGSHEAFTRAFASYFGCLPSSVREARSTDNLALMEPLKMEKSLLVDVAAPQMRDRDAFQVVGLSVQCSFEDVSAIPEIWGAFNEREAEIASAISGVAYGVCCDADGSGRFRYVAGVEAEVGAEIPPDMDTVAIPANRYAVFTHSGHISDLPKTVYTIWNKALPDSEIEPAKAADFELYDSRFNPSNGRGEVEIWIPIVQP